jgi:hypothetical protein
MKLAGNTLGTILKSLLWPCKETNGRYLSMPGGRRELRHKPRAMLKIQSTLMTFLTTKGAM